MWKATILWSCMLTILLAYTIALSGNQVCQLCEKGLNGLNNPYYYIPELDKTCAGLVMELAKISSTSVTCKNTQNRYRNICCNAKEIAKPQPPKVIIPDVKYVGPYPVCKICQNGRYPGKTSMVSHFLNFGKGSCKQYYIFGLEGKIPKHLCSAVQYYANDPCACSLGIVL